MADTRILRLIAAIRERVGDPNMPVTVSEDTKSGDVTVMVPGVTLKYANSELAAFEYQSIAFSRIAQDVAMALDSQGEGNG